MGAKLRDYGMLVKLRLNLTVVFSAAMAYVIATEGAINWLGLGLLILAGFMVTGAANALNQVLEREYDAMMQRTADRPLAAGRMTVSEAVMVAGLLSFAGVALLAFFNPWAAILGMLSMILYAFVYTPLKRVGPIAVFVGAIPGALPTMIGCVAFEGQITLLAVVLFAIQFLWQFPHFWAIAWLSHEDYLQGGFHLLPSAHGTKDENVGRQSMWYALMLIPVSLLPWWLNYNSLVASLLLVLLSIGYAWKGYQLYQYNDRATARKQMFYAFLYLPAALCILYIDKLIG